VLVGVGAAAPGRARAYPLEGAVVVEGCDGVCESSSGLIGSCVWICMPDISIVSVSKLEDLVTCNDVRVERGLNRFR
jgi:hypothetical protein